MKHVIFLLLLWFSASLIVESTINICIPRGNSGDVNDSEVLENTKKSISGKLDLLSAANGEPNLVIDHLDVNLSHPAISIHGTLDDVRIYNLLDLQLCFLENIDIDGNSYTFDVFNLTFTHLRLEGKYDLVGDMGDVFDIYGNSTFWLEFKNMSIAVTDFTFHVTEEAICMPINIDINIVEVDVKFINFMFDDELSCLFNKMLATIGPEALKLVWSDIKEVFDKPLEDAINDILKGNSVLDLLAVIKKTPMSAASHCLVQPVNKTMIN